MDLALGILFWNLRVLNSEGLSLLLPLLPLHPLDRSRTQIPLVEFNQVVQALLVLVDLHPKESMEVQVLWIVASPLRVEILTAPLESGRIEST